MAMYITKDTNAVLDYQNDWSDWLGVDTITTSTWTVPTGLTRDSYTNTATTATIWLSGGTDGTTYEIVNRIVTTAGRTEDKSIFVSVVAPALGEQIARLRRMVNEPTETTYSDGMLIEYVKRYALIDKLGTSPKYILQFNSGASPTFTDNQYWIPTYDLNAAAADVWQEKATTYVDGFDFTADNATYNRSQQYAMYMKQAMYYRSRRSPGSIDLTSWSGEPTAADMSIVNSIF